MGLWACPWGTPLIRLTDVGRFTHWGGGGGILIHGLKSMTMKEENELTMSIHGLLPLDCGPLLRVPAAMMACYHDDLLP